MILQAFWPYLLILAILFGIKHWLRLSRKMSLHLPEKTAQKPTPTAPVFAAGETIALAHEPPQPAAPLAACALCGKAVSAKVEAYCRNHESQFQGRIYCFQHQKQ